ncbi:MAG: ThiF family adenylyltransferase, partial [Deltaproteobacteria bacterium]|nr:ThiF family adenylyltransferase [Deltaproteobacteria bacterium]
MKKEDIFARNIACWGEEQQNFLAGKSVFIAGVGALGCIVAEILVRSGIGRLYIADRGIIDPPDLNRQALYNTSDMEKAKVSVASQRLRAMTGQTEI